MDNNNTLLKKDNNRIALFDIVRVITAYLVIFGHLLPKDNLRGFIYLFHMPLFFLVSGILHKQVDFKTEFIKSAKVIIIPFVSFLIIPTIIDSFIIGPHESFDWLKWSINSTIKSGPIFTNWVLWFLVVLFNIKLIANLILRISPIAWFFIWIFGYWISGKFNYFFFAQTIMAIPFFILGFYAKKYIVSIMSIKKYYNILISILAILLMACIYHYNGKVSVNMCLYGSFDNTVIRILLFYIGALLGIYAIFSLSTLFKGNKTFTYLANSLITIMCAQYIFIDLLQPVSNDLGLFGKSLMSLFIMLLCFIVHQIIIKYTPQILGKF